MYQFGKVFYSNENFEIMLIRFGVDGGSLVDLSGQVARAEAIIDIYYPHPGGTAIEHCQKCRQSLEAGAIANASWDGNDRHLDQPTYDGRQCSFHASNSHDHVGLL